MKKALSKSSFDLWYMCLSLQDIRNKSKLIYERLVTASENNLSKYIFKTCKYAVHIALKK